MSGAADEGAPPPDRHRVFFALWPDDATRSAISRATRDAVSLSGGRPIAKDRLHLTVAFLGELTTAGLEAANGRKSEAARLLGMNRRTLYRREERHDASEPDPD